MEEVIESGGRWKFLITVIISDQFTLEQNFISQRSKNTY